MLALDPFEAVPAFLITLAFMLPVFGICIVAVIRWMIDGDIPTGVGIGVLGGMLGLMAIGIKGEHPAAPWVVLGIVVTLMLFFPFAANQLAFFELRLVNIDRLERAHEELARRPDNVPAAFQMARTLHAIGHRGHAIALTTQVLESLDQTPDPLQFRSMKDLFREEQYELKQWQMAAKPTDFAPIACPMCGAKNPPGPIACVQCQKPYLLEIARRTDVRPRFIGRLVVAWLMIAFALVGASFASFFLEGAVRLVAFLGCLLTAGAILWWLFGRKTVVA